MKFNINKSISNITTLELETLLVRPQGVFGKRIGLNETDVYE